MHYCPENVQGHEIRHEELENGRLFTSNQKQQQHKFRSVLMLESKTQNLIASLKDRFCSPNSHARER